METQVVNVQQALSILDQVAAKYQGTRQEHHLLSQAVQLLSQLVEEKGTK